MVYQHQESSASNTASFTGQGRGVSMEQFGSPRAPSPLPLQAQQQPAGPGVQSPVQLQHNQFMALLKDKMEFSQQQRQQQQQYAGAQQPQQLVSQ